VVVAVLYFAREVFIPLALSILFTFLLAPLVLRLRHWGMPRVPAVVISVTFAFAIVAVTAGLVAIQLADLGQKVPEYQNNIREKLHAVRDSSNGILRRVTRVVNEFQEELSPPAPPPTAPGATKPVPVEIQREAFSPLEMGRTVIGGLLNLLILAAIVIVFVIFMLLQREDLRDRFIRLVGTGQLNITTQALDDAGHRVSRYLIAQLIVNVAFAVPAGFGLYLIGVPNPVLWAVIAALLRYIPYLGMWFATIMPAAVAFAIDPGWAKPLLVVALYFGIDVFMYNFVEPWVYGSSTGITPLGILFAAVFWTWLWGPVGLLLATPLTVCVVVIGRYVPSLRFLSILLSDEPVLSPENRFYQRLLAADVEEATEVAEEFLKGKSLEELYDAVILPALSMAEQDRHKDRFDPDQQKALFQNLRLILEHLAERADEIVAESPEAKNRLRDDAGARVPTPAPSEITVLSLPARDEADELAALMLAQLLNARGIGAKAVSASALAAEQLDEIERENAGLAVVVAVPPSGHLHTRYLCKRLRSQFHELKIVAALLSCGDVQELKKRQPPIPADEIATTLSRTVAEVLSLVPATREPAPQKAFSL